MLGVGGPGQSHRDPSFGGAGGLRSDSRRCFPAPRLRSHLLTGLPLQRDPAFQPLFPSWTKPGRLTPGWGSLLPGTAHAQRL